MIKKATYITLLLLSIGLISCGNKVFYTEQQAVNEHGWRPDEPVEFNVEVTDTNQIFNFLVEVRNTIAYPYANTFLFIRTDFPDGTWSQDTLEFPLADESGRWYGKRTGRLVDTRYYFRRNARFPMPGKYTFGFCNGMRDSAITGIKDVGFRIEYSNMN